MAIDSGGWTTGRVHRPGEADCAESTASTASPGGAVGGSLA